METTQKFAALKTRPGLIDSACESQVASLTAKSRVGYFSIGARAGAIPELDGLRGIAILLVLLRHAARPVYEEHGVLFAVGAWDIAVPLLNGWMGVDLFFVLSGFLITHHLLKRWPGKFTGSFALRYWAKRILRTFPAYYTCVLLVAFGALPFYQPEINNLGSVLLKHFLFLQDYTGSELVPAFWSLGVEEKFYIICPLAMLLLGRYPQHRQFGVLLALAVIPLMLRLLTLYANQDFISSYPVFFWIVRAPTHVALDGLWIGVICALIYRWRPGSIATNHRLPKILFTFGLTLFALIFFSFAWFDAEYFWAATVVLALTPLAFASMMLATIFSDTPVGSFLKSRWLRFLATTSYSIYLTHLMVVPPALHLAHSLFAYNDQSPIVQFLIFIPVFLLFSVMSGLILHLLVEKPFLLIKDRIRL